MQEQILKDLLAKYRAGTLTEEERALLENWATEHTDPEFKIAEADLQKDLAAIARRLPLSGKVRPLWPRIAVAASVLIALSIGGYELLHQPAQQETAQSKTNDIAPGSNKAILTLANGQKISVTDAKNGIIAKQAGIQVKKTQSGNLVYIVNNGAASGSATSGTNEVAYNTIETPRGGQTHVALPDGTVVYLDAASSIRFPLAFNGKDRHVVVTGQVYFEVVHNAKQPFNVTVKGETIQDIGTHFNVNAYDDEPAIKTTLIEGAVSVASRNLKIVLQPGQQAIDNGKALLSARVNTDQVIAWKNGEFNFVNDNIHDVMRQLSRWYNIDVVYEGKVTGEGFNAIISRNKQISSMLNVLQQTKGVHFKIEGRRITVMQ